MHFDACQDQDASLMTDCSTVRGHTQGGVEAHRCQIVGEGGEAG